MLPAFPAAHSHVRIFGCVRSQVEPYAWIQAFAPVWENRNVQEHREFVPTSRQPVAVIVVVRQTAICGRRIVVRHGCRCRRVADRDGWLIVCGRKALPCLASRKTNGRDPPTAPDRLQIKPKRLGMVSSESKRDQCVHFGAANVRILNQANSKSTGLRGVNQEITNVLGWLRQAHTRAVSGHIRGDVPLSPRCVSLHNRLTETAEDPLLGNTMIGGFKNILRPPFSIERNLQPRPPFIYLCGHANLVVGHLREPVVRTFQISRGKDYHLGHVPHPPESDDALVSQPPDPSEVPLSQLPDRGSCVLPLSLEPSA